MFFRREKPRTITFEDRLQQLRELGFKTESAGARTLVSRHGCGAMVTDGGADGMVLGKPGWLLGKDVGVLTHGGYQMFFRTEAGAMQPARAEQLKALHAFTEDLKEAAGQTSWYNTSLGTVCESHLYDRVEQRDKGAAPKAWQR